LQELVGRGGFGEVWKAHDPDLNRPVALKFPNPKRELSEELYQSFRREAEKMASLERVSGVVPVYEAGESQGIPFIASSFIDGEDLSVRQKKTPLSYEESARIVADVAETLHRAHLKDFFHRDVKLSNILIDKEGQVFLSDFGLCVSEQEQLHEGHSATGTYAYMAPEQIHGNSHRVDGRADIYALGVVLYRLLTGRLPFIGNTSVEYMEQTLKKAPRPPRSIDDQIPEELERICLKCLNKKVEDRYAIAGDLARDLRNWLSSLEPHPVAQPAQVTTLPETSFAQRHPLLIALAMLFIALGGLFAWKPELAHNVLLARLWTDDDKEQPNGQPDTPAIYLRDAAPEALQRSDEESEPEWVLVKGRNAVEVKEKRSRFCMKSLGELEPGQVYDIKIDLLEIKPDSAAGIFFGMSQQLVNSAESYWQSIVVLRDDTGKFQLIAKFNALRNDVPHDSSFRKRDIEIGEKAAREKVTLRIVVSEKGIQEISVNGESYDDLAEEFRTELPKELRGGEKEPGDIDWASTEDFRGTGRFGLICHWRRAIFADPVINDVQYNLEFQKTE
jgi:serine/threonine protein kinase